MYVNRGAVRLSVLSHAGFIPFDVPRQHLLGLGGLER